MMNKLKENFAPFVFATIIIGLFTFPFWSHFHQDKQINKQAEKISNMVVTDSDLLVGASALFAQNASVQLNLEVLGTYASTSGNFSFNGEIMPDGATCSNGQILKRTGANDWDCAADSTGTFDSTTVDDTTWSDSANATNVWTFDVSGTDHTLTFGSNYSLFSGGVSTSLNFEAVGYASASKYFGTALTDCDSNGSQLLWSDTGLYSCQTLADADIPDTLTITNLSGTNTGDVTLAGTPNYLTLSGQQITLTKLDISDDTNATGGTGITLSTNDFSFASTEVEATTWGAGGNASNLWTFNLSAGDPTLNWTQSGASLSLNFEAIGYASASKYLGIAFDAVGDCNDDGEALNWTTTGLFGCNTLADADIPDGITVNGGTIGSNNISATSTWTTLGLLTIGDGGDRIDFATDTWDVANGVFSGVAGMTGTGVYDFGGATSFEIPQNGTVNATGEFTLNTASNSEDWYNGTRIVVQKEETCDTIYIEDPTSTNDKWIGHKRFNDPITITEVLVVASGANAAGWNLYYGNPGSLTTTVFTLNKSASTSSSPRYTSFANSTLTEGQVLDAVITSPSATLQSFAPTVCYRYNH